jgi:hypothetical protein
MDGRRTVRVFPGGALILLLIMMSLVFLGCENPLEGFVEEEVQYAKAVSRTLNIQDAANATVTPSGARQVKEGYPETVKVFPESGYFFVQWEVVGSDGGGTVVFRNGNASTVEVTLTGGDATIRPVVANIIGSVVINSNALYTTSPTVSLALHAENGNTITEMRISNASTFEDNNWQPYASSSTWDLSGGSGQKNVHVWFKDNTGAVSPRSSDTIILDLDPPTVEQVSPSHNAGGVPVNPTMWARFSEDMNGSTITSSSILLGRTAGSYLEGTSVSYNAGTRTASLSYSGTLQYNNESYTIEVTSAVEDLAGNNLASPFSSSFRTKNKEAAISFLDSVSSPGPYFKDFVVIGNEAFIISRNLGGTTYGRLYRVNMSNRSNIAITENRDIRNSPHTAISDGTYLYIAHQSAPIRKVRINNFSEIADEASGSNSGLIARSGNNQIVKVYSDDLYGVLRSSLSSGVIHYNNSYLYDAVVMETMGNYTFIGEVYYDMEPSNTLQAYNTFNFNQGAASLEDTLSLDSYLSSGDDISSLDQYDGEYMVVGNRGTNGLLLLDVTDPGNISFEKSISVSGVEDVSVWDIYAAAARGGNGIGFVDLQSSSNQILIPAQVPDVSGQVHKIHFDGTYLYILSGSSANTLNTFQVYKVDIY